jgi:hypothetical protein
MYMSLATHIHVTRIARMKDNEMRHVIHDTRISSSQCPRRDVMVWYGLQGHTEYTPEERHIHVNMCINSTVILCTYPVVKVATDCRLEPRTSILKCCVPVMNNNTPCLYKLIWIPFSIPTTLYISRYRHTQTRNSMWAWKSSSWSVILSYVAATAVHAC